jgi:transcriptional regulator with XRE-family HTH domain
MTLDAYLRKHGISAASLARKLKCSDVSISNWRCGYQRPGPALMKRIAQVTGGEVNAADFPPARSRLAVRLASLADATRAE